MTQDELKQAVAKAAADYVAANVPVGGIIGVGTGSTANFFIDALAPLKDKYKGAVASSEATRKRLEGHGFTVFDLNDIDDLPFYVDGADEIDAGLNMIKGGGGALLRMVTNYTQTQAGAADLRWRVPVFGSVEDAELAAAPDVVRHSSTR